MKGQKKQFRLKLQKTSVNFAEKSKGINATRKVTT